MGTCQSCGRDGEEVTAVQRVYLLDLAGAAGAPDEPDGADAEPVRIEDEVEYWCWSCRESFPHVPMTPADDGDPAD